MKVALLGGWERRTAYSRVNGFWRGLLQKAGWEVLAEGPAPISIHHDYSQDFCQVRLPPQGRRIAVRTWDFGPYPRAWVERLEQHWDELWVHSQWVRSQALAAGWQRVSVLPNGVDCSLYRPDLPPYFPEDGLFRFLFVGASVHRKGVDTLLKAFCLAFAEGEAVRLVIKDHTRDVFYQGIDLRSQLLGQPGIEYLDDYLEDATLASLMASCQAGVFPYRAEGFAMPILEAMACGLPCLVPRFGACLDFCSEENACFVPVRRIQLPVGHNFAYNTLGFSTRVEEVDYCEIRPEVLAAEMRRLWECGPEQLRRRGRRAAADVAAGWSWDQVGARLESLLRAAGTSA